jgi:triosephosphate isomerase (TIM)
MRRQIVAGNWKMNKNLEEGLKLTSEIVHMVADEVNNKVEVILAPPFTHLSTVRNLLKGQDKVHLSAQNCHWEENGAFTGEISAGMLKSVGAQFVIIGHSERREYFSETSEQLAKKVDSALAHSLTPIFCCGETLDIREEGAYVNFVTSQLKEGLFHLSASDLEGIIIAYEPVWAIGTGKTASTEQAQEMHKALRNFIAEEYSPQTADTISILYGGSCKPSNAPELFACKDVDGGLIGGASLSSRDFVDILKSF